MVKSSQFQSSFLSLHCYYCLCSRVQKFYSLHFASFTLKLEVITTEMHMWISAGKILLYGLYLLKCRLLRKALKSLMKKDQILCSMHRKSWLKSPHSWTVCLDCHNGSSESQINYVSRVKDFLSRLNHIGIAAAKSLVHISIKGKRFSSKLMWIRFNRIMLSEVDDTKVCEFPFTITTKHSQINGSWKTVWKLNTENCKQMKWNRSQCTVAGNTFIVEKSIHFVPFHCL